MTPIRVLVADDHPVVREGLTSFLRSIDDMELVGEASNGIEAVEACEQLQPDVILMDLIMPEMDGVEATGKITTRYPNVHVLMLTTFVDETQIQNALRAGATGYMLKNASVQELLAAIRAAFHGETTLAPGAVKALIKSKAQKPAPNFNLKERELEILGFMVAGLTNSEIAYRMELSPSTVKFHVSTILTKLNVKSRTEAVALAMQHNLIAPNDD